MVIILPLYTSIEWHDAFYAAAYEVISHPFIISHDRINDQNRNQSKVPKTDVVSQLL